MTPRGIQSLLTQRPAGRGVGPSKQRSTLMRPLSLSSSAIASAKSGADDGEQGVGILLLQQRAVMIAFPVKATGVRVFSSGWRCNLSRLTPGGHIRSSSDTRVAKPTPPPQGSRSPVAQAKFIGSVTGRYDLAVGRAHPCGAKIVVRIHGKGVGVQAREHRQK